MGEAFPPAASFFVSSRVVTPVVCVARVALAVGWHLPPTDGIGDCGPDVMPYATGLGLAPEVWLDIIHQIANFMEFVVAEELWYREATANLA